MKKKLSCEQVISLVEFFLSGKLSSSMQNSVSRHLKECVSCKKFYDSKNSDLSFLNSNDYISGFVDEKLSAYIDNEVDDEEAVKIRKITITNPSARKNLEDMYRLRRELHLSVARTKNDCKTDYSRSIINKISGENIYYPFIKVVWTFAVMMCFIMCGFVFILHS